MARHAAAAALEGLLPAGTELRYNGAVVSGSIGAVWEPAPLPPACVARAAVLRAAELRLELPLRPMEPVAEAEARLSGAEARLAGAADEATRRRETPLVEQARRNLRKVMDWGTGERRVPVWVYHRARHRTDT
jgi:hypothetical protein